MTKFLCKIQHSIPALLSITASLGVVATAVLSIKATPKALNILKKERSKRENELKKLDIVKATWHCYIPAALVGVSTIGCIFGANTLNHRQQASLASAYALISQSYREYQEKVKELYGEEAHKAVLTALATEKVDKNHIIIADARYRATTLDFGDINEEVRTFYDCFSNRAFESTISKVLEAEYHLNRNFALGGLYVELNNFYELLGIDPIDNGKILGWDCAEDIVWIDFNHYKDTLDDGMEIYYIEMMLEPQAFE